MCWIPPSRSKWGSPRTESKGLASEGEGTVTVLMAPHQVVCLPWLRASKSWVLDPREKGWSSEHGGLWDPSQTGSKQQTGASHLQTVTFRCGGGTFCVKLRQCFVKH